MDKIGRILNFRLIKSLRAIYLVIFAVVLTLMILDVGYQPAYVVGRLVTIAAIGDMANAARKGRRAPK